jgi:integrase
VAEERDLIPRNPVRVNTRNRKLKAKRKRPVYLESAEQIIAMIDAATELDVKPQARTAGRRALIATLVYAGLRIGEASALTWQDIDLANGAATSTRPPRRRSSSSRPPAAAVATRTTRASV